MRHVSLFFFIFVVYNFAYSLDSEYQTLNANLVVIYPVALSTDPHNTRFGYELGNVTIRVGENCNASINVVSGVIAIIKSITSSKSDHTLHNNTNDFRSLLNKQSDHDWANFTARYQDNLAYREYVQKQLGLNSQQCDEWVRNQIDKYDIEGEVYQGENEYTLQKARAENAQQERLENYSSSCQYALGKIYSHYASGGHDDDPVKKLYEQRIEKVKHCKQTFERTHWNPDESTKKFLKKHNLDPQKYSDYSGEPLQVILHNQMVEVLYDVYDLCNRYETSTHIQSLGKTTLRMVESARNANIQKDMIKACMLTDLSMHMVNLARAVGHYMESVALGTYEGVHDVADMICHPIDHVVGVAKGLTRISVSLARIICISQEIDGFRQFSDPYSQKLYLQKKEQLAQELRPFIDWTKEVSTWDMPHILRFGTRLVVGSVLTGQVNSGVAKLYKTASKQAKILVAAKLGTNIRSVLKEAIYYVPVAPNVDLVLPIAENLEYQIVQRTRNVLNNITQYGTHAFEMALEEAKIINGFIALEKELPHLQSMCDICLPGIPEWNGKVFKPRTIPHVLKIECKYALQPDGTKKFINWTGFHHDMCFAYEQLGIVKIGNKIINADATYEGWVIFNGVKRYKTFFPAHWSRAEVVEEILGAYNNRSTPEILSSGKTIIYGIGPKGIEIEMTIKNNGELISAYPTSTLLGTRHTSKVKL